MVLVLFVIMWISVVDCPVLRDVMRQALKMDRFCCSAELTKFSISSESGRPCRSQDFYITE